MAHSHDHDHPHDHDHDHAEELRMTVRVTESGPSRKRLAIDIPADVVDEKLGESIDTLILEAELPGFRKGRAPKRLVEKKFGGMIRSEAKRALVSQAIGQAIEKEKLKVIGNPSSESLDKAELVSGQPLAFEVDVEVQPAFTMPNLDGIKVRKPTFEITAERLDAEVRKIAINEGDLEPRDAAEPGDYVTGRGVMTGPAGEEFYNIDGAVVRVPVAEDNGKGMILGVVVDDFAAQFGLPTPGATATIKATGPQNHEREELRGKPLTITFTVARIDRIIPAEVSDLVARYGMDSEDQLKDAIRTRLTQRGLVEQQSALRSQIARYLLDNTQMELPERLTSTQAARTIERRRMELMYRGVDEQQIEAHMAEFRAGSADIAQRELKLFFVLHQAAEDMGIAVTEAEVNGRIAQLAMERGQRPEEFRRRLIESGQAQNLAMQIREHKTMDMILSKATVEDVSAEEFAKLAAE